MSTWKILEVIKDGELISQAKYHVKLASEDLMVETEGHWYFSDKEVKTNFSDVKEADVINWIKSESMQNGINIIESRLEEQLASLQNEQKVLRNQLLVWRHLLNTLVRFENCSQGYFRIQISNHFERRVAQTQRLTCSIQASNRKSCCY